MEIEVGLKNDLRYVTFFFYGANSLTLQSVGWEFCNVIGLICPSGNIEWWTHIFRKWKTFIMAVTECFHWDSVCFTHLRTYQCPEEHQAPVDIQTIYCSKGAFSWAKQATNSFPWHCVKSLITRILWSTTNLSEIWPLLSKIHSVVERHICAYILVCLGHRNKIPHTVGLTQRKFIISQFWRLEVQDQGADRFGFQGNLHLLGLLLYFFTWLSLCIHVPLLSEISSLIKHTSQFGLEAILPTHFLTP